MDESEKFYNPDPWSNIIHNPLNLNWYFFGLNYCTLKILVYKFLEKTINLATNKVSKSSTIYHNSYIIEHRHGGEIHYSRSK